MNGHRTLTPHTVAASLLALVITVSAIGAAAQPDEFRAVMQVESPGEATMEMVYFVSGEQLRMDISQDASFVWTGGGAAATVLMIQHPDKQYMRWGEDQLNMMRQMMSRMPGGGTTAGSEPSFDPTQITFEETGRREQIGEWDAFEIKMTQPDQPATFLWLTTDTETGLFALSRRVADVASALQMPMAGGGAPSAQQLARYQALASAQGLPAGQVVRIVTSEGDDASHITLTSVEPGPQPPQTFEPPADYNEMQMPSLPGGLPGLPGRD